MATSWFIGKDQPDLSSRPEGWSTPAKRKYPGGKGTESVIVAPVGSKVELKEYPKKITFDGDWYLSKKILCI